MKHTIMAMLIVALMSGVSYADVAGSGPGSPFADPGTVTSDIVFNVDPDEIVKDIEITINQMTHTWLGDLTATLTHVDTATSADIFVQVGGGGGGDTSDFNGNYTFGGAGDLWAVAAGLGSTEAVPSGAYFASDSTGAPVFFADAFAGQSVNGTWRLSINDQAGGDTGGFGSWDIRILSNPVPEPTSLAVVALVGLAGFVRRRR